MANEQKRNPSEEEKNTSPANIGNASNPAPGDESLQEGAGNQLLDEKAEKYLREVASIEDVPDAQDQQEMDKTLRQSNQEDK